jgi:hypothetical protein
MHLLQRHGHGPWCPGPYAAARFITVQIITVQDLRRAVDPQPALTGKIDEQQPQPRIDQDIAQGIEHAVAGIIGEEQFPRPQDPNRRQRHALRPVLTALEAAITMAAVVSGVKKKVGYVCVKCWPGLSL